MKLLLDMNLSPEFVGLLAEHGVIAVHWSTVGLPTAEDGEILRWAKDHEYVVVTFDLDFGTILAATGFHTPSVIQIRNLNSHPDVLCPLLVKVLKRFDRELANGALIVLDKTKDRIRLLPLTKKQN